MMQDPHIFDYRAAAAETAKSFPEEMRDVFFFDSRRREHVPGHPEANLKIRTQLLLNKPLRDGLNQNMRRYAGEKNSVVMKIDTLGRAILLYTGHDGITLLGKNAPTGQKICFVFDHEVGHIVTAYGSKNPMSHTLHECCADAYAALRQMQRYGADTPAAAALLLGRAQRLVSLQGSRHGEHFTSFVLDQVIETAQTLPVQKLSPAQTAQLATRLALAHTPNDQIVTNLMETFAPFQEQLAAQDGSDAPYRTLAQIVLETSDWETFKWGAPVLRGYINGDLPDMQNGNILIRINQSPLEGGDWARISSQLTAREFAFAKQQILFGLDLPSPAQDNAATMPPRLRTPRQA